LLEEWRWAVFHLTGEMVSLRNAGLPN
jgi:hypothetical protein